MPRSPKADQVEAAVLTRACFMVTDNPIVGVDQNVTTFILQIKKNVENFAPASFGKSKHHDRSSPSTHDFL